MIAETPSSSKTHDSGRWVVPFAQTGFLVFRLLWVAS